MKKTVLNNLHLGIDEYKEMFDDLVYIMNRIDNKYSKEFGMLDKHFFYKNGKKLMLNMDDKYAWLITENQLEIYNKSLEDTLNFKNKKSTLEKLTELYLRG